MKMVIEKETLKMIDVQEKMLITTIKKFRQKYLPLKVKQRIKILEKLNLNLIRKNMKMREKLKKKKED